MATRSFVLYDLNFAIPNSNSSPSTSGTYVAADSEAVTFVIDDGGSEDTRLDDFDSNNGQITDPDGLTSQTITSGTIGGVDYAGMPIHVIAEFTVSGSDGSSFLLYSIAINAGLPNGTTPIISGGPARSSVGTGVPGVDDGLNNPLVVTTAPFVENVTYTISAQPGFFVAAPDYDDLLLCFSGETSIKTDRGEVAIRDLSQDDLVLTADARYQPIRWIGSRHMSSAMLKAEPKLRPIRIKAGALGKGLPHQDLLVSPQHRMLVKSKIVQRMFDTQEVLVAAKHLVLLPGIDVANDVEDVTYHHMLFDDHQIVWANGALSESLYTGPQALKSLSPEAREEIFTIFPEIADINYEATSCRKLTTGRMGRKIAIRHKNNQRQLVS